MKNFKKILSLVLCALMLVGLAPVAINTNEVVAATTPAVETADTGVIQGENDLVVVLTSVSSTDPIWPNYLVKTLTVTNSQINTAIGKLVKNFDRTILVWAVDGAIAPNNSTGSGGTKDIMEFFAGDTTGAENLVITQKCTVTNTEYLFALDSTSHSATTFTHYSAFKDTHPKPTGGIYNFYDNEDTALNATLSFPNKATAYLKMGHYLEFNYINLKFPEKNLLIYCQGFDLTVGKSVKFTFGGSDAAYRPIVINGDTSTKRNGLADAKQTITLLGGHYQYVSPRSRGRQLEYKDVTIDLVLGGVRFVHGSFSWLFGDDYYSGTTVNVHLNGTDYRDPLYIVGATENGTSTTAAATPTIEDCVVNIYMNAAELNENGGIVGAFIPAQTYNKAYEIKSLEVNLFLKNVDLVKSADVIRTIKPEVDSAGGAIANVTSNVYYDEIGMPASEYGELIYDNFDNEYYVSVADSETTLCGTEGTNLYRYKDANGDLVDASWECDAAAARSEIVLNVGKDAGPAKVHCRHCLDKHVIDTTEDGAPIVYVDRANGSDTATGYNIGEAKMSLAVASQVVAKWKRGGTIVVCSDQITSTDQTLVDTNGVLTITSYYDSDTQEYTQMYNGGGLNTQGDLRFDNLHIKGTTKTKPIFLNWNNFTVEDNCVYYPVEGEDSYKLSVITGARAGIPEQLEAYGTDVSGIDQKVELNSLSWHYINAGSKVVATEVEGVAEYYLSTHDQSVNCSGNTSIAVSGTATVQNVDLVSAGVENKLYLNTGDVAILNNESGETVKTRENGEGTVEVYGSFDTFNSAECVYVCDGDRFGTPMFQQKVQNSTVYAVRLAYTTANDFAAWVDASAVSEFGVLMSLDTNAESIKYITTSHENGIGKAVAYDETNRNYLYSGGDTAVEFHATLLAQNDNGDDLSAELKQYDYACVPYAVVDGEFTVIGDITYFDWLGILE